jgi:hypothetical protein
VTAIAGDGICGSAVAGCHSTHRVVLTGSART